MLSWAGIFALLFSAAAEENKNYLNNADLKK